MALKNRKMVIHVHKDGEEFIVALSVKIGGFWINLAHQPCTTLDGVSSMKDFLEAEAPHYFNSFLQRAEYVQGNYDMVDAESYSFKLELDDEWSN